MIKAKQSPRPRILELKKETLVVLGDHALREVVGGNLTTVPSQCRTLCF